MVLVPGAQQAPADQVVDAVFLGGEVGSAGRSGGGDDGVMVGDLGIVDIAAAEGAFAGSGRELLAVGFGDGSDDARQGSGDILRKMTAIGTRIADQLVTLVEGLGDVQGLLRAEAVEAVGVPLQFGQIVEQRRRHALRLRLDGFDGCLSGAGARFDARGFFAVRREPHGLLERFLIGAGGSAVAQPGALVSLLRRGRLGMKGGLHLKVVFRHEAANGELPLDEHSQRGSLHAPHGKVFAIGEGVGAGKVHAHQPVGAAAAAGRIGEGIVVGARLQVVETAADGVRGERRDPEPAHRL